jgi:hypothetical protein
VTGSIFSYEVSDIKANSFPRQGTTMANNSDGNSSPESSTQPDKDKKPSLGIVGMIGSVFAAIIGIQSQKNRERDFKKGNPSDFILLGVIFVFLLVVGMIAFVNSLLPS